MLFADPGNRNLTLAITGASGSLFAREMLRALDADKRVARVHLVISSSALRVLAEESGINGRNTLAEKLLGRSSAKIVQLAHEDIGAPIASGSYPSDGMIVLPCSMGTLAGIAHGLAGNLIVSTSCPLLPGPRDLAADTSRADTGPLASARQKVDEVVAVGRALTADRDASDLVAAGR